MQALRATTDHRGLAALVARAAAAHSERARVFRQAPEGWRLVVEATASSLRWGGGEEPGALPLNGSLTMTPICHEEARALLLVTVGLSRDSQGALEALCREAATAHERLSATGASREEWWSLTAQQRRALLDGLVARTRGTREASRRALVARGLDLDGYHPDLPRRQALELRREVEELANARRWWAFHLA